MPKPQAKLNLKLSYVDLRRWIFFLVISYFIIFFNYCIFSWNNILKWFRSCIFLNIVHSFVKKNVNIKIVLHIFFYFSNSNSYLPFKKNKKKLLVWFWWRSHNHGTFSDQQDFSFRSRGHLITAALDFDWIHQAHLWYWLSKLDFPLSGKSSETSCRVYVPACRLGSGGLQWPAALESLLSCARPAHFTAKTWRRNLRRSCKTQVGQVQQLPRPCKHISQFNRHCWLFTIGLWEHGLCVSSVLSVFTADKSVSAALIPSRWFLPNKHKKHPLPLIVTLFLFPLK